MRTFGKGHHVGGLPFKGFLAGQRSGPVETSWSSTKGNAATFTTGWGMTSWKAAWQERAWRSWWTNWLWASNVAFHKGGILRDFRRRTASRSRKRVFPFCSALVRPPLECCVQFWAPQPRKDWHRFPRASILGNIQNPTGCGTEQSVLADPCFEHGGWTRWSPDLLQTSTVLWATDVFEVFPLLWKSNKEILAAKWELHPSL